EGWCVQQACDFIDGSGDAPFCMQVSLPKPHQCYTPDARFWEMYPDDLDLPETFNDDPSQRPAMFQEAVQNFQQLQGQYQPQDNESLARRIWKGYLACITHVDHALGLLMDHLEKSGQADRTIVIYHSDHGAYSTRYGLFEKAPGICSESVCRVPYLWHVPGMTPAGKTCEQLVENIDIAATITGLCNIPAMTTTDGKNIAPLLQGKDEPVRQMAVTEHAWSKSIRWEQWRLVHYQPDMFEGKDVGELYDLKNDPLERRNLYHDPASEHLVHQGRQLLLQWLIDTTRPCTVWPAPNWPSMKYDLAPDGKESNKAGVKLRVTRGQLAYL
ncbi:MAG: sulfatase-like hydrolase/transferase, partial [Phycisphaeraceae bacterium]|nr:sulfatase-like hydrolase/transferase [Phycisphaeraceae bacterium]